MKQDHTEASLQTLQDIKSIMERSARFLSLSGWSGVWAGIAALAGSYIAGTWLRYLPETIPGEYYNTVATKFVLLAISVLIVAFAGGVFFTWQKTSKQGHKLWNSASRKMLVHISIPFAVGGLFALNMLYNHNEDYVVPVCLAFYGLSLINGSKYTFSDIQYLGILEVILASINLFMPQYGLLFWSLGFGVLHILYGIMMWNKYDKRNINQ